MLGGIDKNHILEEVPKQHRLNKQEADNHRGDGQQHQGNRHHPGRLVRLVIVAMTMVVVVMRVVVCVRVLVVAFLAMEDQEIHAERIERRDKYTSQNSKVREACSGEMALMDGFDNAVLGIETGEQGCTNQRQRAKQRCDPGDRHVFAYAPHPTDVLVMVHAHDDRARTEEQQRLEEGVRHQVEYGNGVG